MSLYLLAVFVLASLFCLSESLVTTEPDSPVQQNVLEVVKVSNHHHASSCCQCNLYIALILGPYQTSTALPPNNVCGVKCLINSLNFCIFLKFTYNEPLGGYYLFKGETQCIFSPQDSDGRMLEVNDCYVIEDTIRFFSENNGAFCLSLRYTFRLKPPPSREKEHLGDVGDWNSE